MRAIIVGLLLLIGMTGQVQAQDQELYDLDNVTKIEIQFYIDNWDIVLDNLYDAENGERIPATVTINGIQYDSAGVRYKGNSTYRANNKKNPFNIKLDYVHDADYGGYETLKLSNGLMDPSWVREVLGYEIIRKYAPAPCSNYAAVYINGSYHGLYSSSQSIDKVFLKEHYYSKDNVFFKGNTDTKLQDNGTTLNYLGNDSTTYQKYYEMKSDFGWSALTETIIHLNTDPAQFEQLIDLDRAVWMLAYNNIFVNLDSYTGRGQNYYLYQDNDGRFSTITWDLNMTFGGFTLGQQPLPGVDLNFLIQYNLFYGENISDKPLLKIILNNETYRRMYVAHARTMVKDIITSEWYKERATKHQALIDAYVSSDKNGFYPYSAMNANLTSTVGSGAAGIVGVCELLDARATWLATQAEFAATPPTISNVAAEGNPSSVVITASVSNTARVTLRYRNTIGAMYTAVQMVDDGLGNDALAGDGVYTATVPAASTLLQYYVYAENNSAGMFDPERAEHDYYEYRNSGDVVINEFMASNDATITDQDGEYDDWVELYNNSGVDVSLNGYFLSDNTDKPTKWVFPDVSIPANGYLIVWCDEDEDQDGLHANFKLSANGESISLYAPDTVLLDQVLFSTQHDDITTGRYPNGTGDFVFMNPTFSAENTGEVSGVDDVQVPESVSIRNNFPNPFNPTTSIPIKIDRTQNVEVTVQNVFGETVATLQNGAMNAGSYVLNWSAGNNSSGVYLCILRTESKVQTIKMVLAR